MEGEEIPVGQVIALILAPEEEAQTAAAQAAGAELAAPRSRPEAGTADAESATLGAQLPGFAPASPKARRLATQRGIDLATVRGTGPEGAVLAADVLAAAAAPAPSAPTQPAAPRPEPAVTASRTWRVMAERMVASWTTAPHFYLVREVVASALVDMRARLVPAVQRRAGVRPTYTDLLIRLVAAALRNHPRLSASWVEGRLRERREINIGVATATEDALVAPVIRGADALSIGEIAARRRELVDRANAGKLSPADISEWTFTITNLGVYGVDAFNAIINPPQAAILAVGRIADRVVAVGGQPAVRPTMILTLSCDHRAVDGARAAVFLDELASLIEEPWGLLA